MSDAAQNRPRTWVPLAAAGAIAAVAVVGALVAFVLRGGPDDVEAAVITACEAEYARGDGSAIAAGEIFDPTEWREHYRLVQDFGEVVVPLDELPPAAVSDRERDAEVFAKDGAGTMVIVWRLEDQSYAQCAVAVAAGAVVAGSAVTGPLYIEDAE